jgi:hypothetical protein
VKCRRSEELWSDYLDGRLSRPLTKDLEDHLAECPGCPELMEAFREVRSAVRTIPHLHPSPQLVERILLASRPRLIKLANQASLVDVASRARFGTPLVPNLSWRGWAAWGTAAALVALLILGPSQTFSRLNQIGHHVYSVGLGAYRNTEGLIDELNVLRMTVGVAFEDRLDRLNQRLKDLEEARRKNNGETNQSNNLGSQRLSFQRGSGNSSQSRSDS